MHRSFVRPIETIDRALAEAAVRKASAEAAIERRQRDMRSALIDIETYEKQAAVQMETIEGLLDERSQSVRMQAEQFAREHELMSEES